MTDSKEVLWRKYEIELWEESEIDMKMYWKKISMRLVLNFGENDFKSLSLYMTRLYFY